jgi:hypothetical protein
MYKTLFILNTTLNLIIVKGFFFLDSVDRAYRNMRVMKLT